MLEICPNCEKECYAETIDENRIITVNGEDIEVAIHLLRCVECSEEFEDRNQRMDELALAYREYRRRHNMLQPETIMGLRKKLNLNYEQLDKLLGFCLGTYEAYEAEYLQSEKDDLAMKTILQENQDKFKDNVTYDFNKLVTTIMTHLEKTK